MPTEVKDYHTLLRYPVPASPPPPDYYARDIKIGASSGELATRVADFETGPAQRPISPHGNDHHLHIITGWGKIKQGQSGPWAKFEPGRTVCLERNKTHYLVNEGNCPIIALSVMVV